jgi:predicted N-acetyltransferase YhbS
MAPDGLILREEAEADRSRVFTVNEAAFKRPDEARLVEALRSGGVVIISLVADLNGTMIGHALFTTIEVRGARTGRKAPRWAQSPCFRNTRERASGRDLRDSLLCGHIR